MGRDTVPGAAAVDTWSSFVKASLGAVGLCLLAAGPLVPKDTGFQYLPQYAFVIGGLLVFAATTMRLRSVLIVLGCVALTAGLAFTLVGGGDPDFNLSALALYSAAALVLGAAGRHIWMAVPFVLVPLLIVAPEGIGWADSREAFSLAWERAVGGPYLLAGLPAGLAVAGAVVGQLRVVKWVPVKPSAVPVLIAASGLIMASLVVGSLMPAKFSFVATVCMRVALLAGVLAWIALAYQIGRLDFVWEAAVACLFFLAGALFLDRATQFPDAVGPTLGITIAASLVPAALAGVGLLARRWIGTERPVTVQPTAQLKRWAEAEQRSFFTAATTAPYDSPKAPEATPPATPPPAGPGPEPAPAPTPDEGRDAPPTPPGP